MSLKTFLISLLLLLSASFANAAPLPTIYVAPTISFAGPTADGSTSPGQDCPWDSRLVAYLAKSSGNRVVVTPRPMEAQGQKLILAARLGPKVGSGEKEAPGWIEVSGRLIDEDGKQIGDFGFRDDRYSGSLHKCKEAIRLGEGLGDSIAGWLEEPTPGIKITETIGTLLEESVDSDIKKSCPWDTELPNYLAGMMSGNVYRVAEDIGKSNDKKLMLTILNSHLLGGGVYTGSKCLKVKGSLTENGREIGSFVAFRHSFRAWTGCGISDRLSYEIAYDISNWLQNPSINARLGDADENMDDQP